MLKAMVEAVGPSPSLTDVRFLAVCLVAFAGFLCCDELIKLRCNDIVLNEQGMVVQAKRTSLETGHHWLLHVQVPQHVL